MAFNVIKGVKMYIVFRVLHFYNYLKPRTPHQFYVFLKQP